jgi:hypothetical protein
MVLWSMTRILWGIATLMVFLWNIELLQDSNTPVWSFLVLFLLFFVCEIIPIITLLENSYFAMIGLDRMSMPALENRNVNVALNTPLLPHYEVDVANNLSNEAEEAN